MGLDYKAKVGVVSLEMSIISLIPLRLEDDALKE